VRLLRPRSVAFIGGETARGALGVCRDSGFGGPDDQNDAVIAQQARAVTP